MADSIFKNDSYDVQVNLSFRYFERGTSSSATSSASTGAPVSTTQSLWYNQELFKNVFSQLSSIAWQNWLNVGRDADRLSATILQSSPVHSRTVSQHIRGSNYVIKYEFGREFIKDEVRSDQYTLRDHLIACVEPKSTFSEPVSRDECSVAAMEAGSVLERSIPQARRYTRRLVRKRQNSGDVADWSMNGAETTNDKNEREKSPTSDPGVQRILRRSSVSASSLCRKPEVSRTTSNESRHGRDDVISRSTRVDTIPSCFPMPVKRQEHSSCSRNSDVTTVGESAQKMASTDEMVTAYSNETRKNNGISYHGESLYSIPEHIVNAELDDEDVSLRENISDLPPIDSPLSAASLNLFEDTVDEASTAESPSTGQIPSTPLPRKSSSSKQSILTDTFNLPSTKEVVGFHLDTQTKTKLNSASSVSSHRSADSYSLSASNDPDELPFIEHKRKIRRIDVRSPAYKAKAKQKQVPVPVPDTSDGLPTIEHVRRIRRTDGRSTAVKPKAKVDAYSFLSDDETLPGKRSSNYRVNRKESKSKKVTNTDKETKSTLKKVGSSKNSGNGAKKRNIADDNRTKTICNGSSIQADTGSATAKPSRGKSRSKCKADNNNSTGLSTVDVWLNTSRDGSVCAMPTRNSAKVAKSSAPRQTQLCSSADSQRETTLNPRCPVTCNGKQIIAGSRQRTDETLSSDKDGISDQCVTWIAESPILTSERASPVFGSRTSSGQHSFSIPTVKIPTPKRLGNVSELVRLDETQRIGTLTDTSEDEEFVYRQRAYSGSSNCSQGELPDLSQLPPSVASERSSGAGGPSKERMKGRSTSYKADVNGHSSTYGNSAYEWSNGTGKQNDRLTNFSAQDVRLPTKVKKEPGSDRGSESQKSRRRLSVVDVRKRLIALSPDVAGARDVCDDVTEGPPDVIEIIDEEQSPDIDDYDPQELESSIQKITDVKDLTEVHLIYLVRKNQDYLRDIIREKSKCRRHDLYQKGGRARDNLTGNVFLQRYDEQQDDVILNSVMDIFSKGTMKYMDYVFKVLFPEILVKIFMDVHKCDYKRAEREMLHVEFDMDDPLGRGKN